MRRFMLWAGSVAALVILGVMAAGWWYLSSDVSEPQGLPGEHVAGLLRHDGLERHWQAYVPATLKPRAPLLLLLHGSRGDGNDMRLATYYGFEVLAEREGALVVYPDGVERHWNDCRASASYAANIRSIDDVGFLRALIARLGERYGVDPHRVYVAGISNGGHMAYRMGLEAPDAVAGIAAYVANLPVRDNLDCEPRDQALPVLIVNGTEDPINPYEGGVVELFGDASRGAVLSARETAAYWADLARYSSEGQHSDWEDRAADDGTRVTTLQWVGPDRPPVALVSVVGGGHTVPDPVFRLPRVLGRTSHELDIAALTWAFFSEGVVQQPPL